MTTAKLNFSSGPATLPKQVLQAAAAAISDLDGSGIGILEHSHRGPEFGAVLARAQASVREVANVPDDYAVIFVTAGATAHFTWIPRSFLSAGETADYCDTGVWAKKAAQAAAPFGNIHVACSSAIEQYVRIPDNISLSVAPRYLHFTSNNTVYGTQWQRLPIAGRINNVALVCDASSDIFSRPIDVNRYAMIYAGAQKNLGPSGISLVIARRSFLATARAGLPPLEDYEVYDRENSMHNTPNTFGIFMIGEVAKWIVQQGGLGAMDQRNRAKAGVLYDFLDNSKLWRGVADPSSRSLMNVTFRGPDTATEEAFLAQAQTRGFEGLRGHRSVGGLRASIYNAFPAQGVERLVTELAAFEKSR
jgi:phosphoserine aminotransferase